uniref:Uncharacterized protein n=1 Tax=Rhizophora mucronata TaxID=61149 RepID=A0A2P2IVY8_RHIMU
MIQIIGFMYDHRVLRSYNLNWDFNNLC